MQGIDVVSVLTTCSGLSPTLFYSLFSFFPFPTINDKHISTCTGNTQFNSHYDMVSLLLQILSDLYQRSVILAGA